LLRVLETANIKLASVATVVFGVSRRLMLQALIEGRANPQEMAVLAKGKLRNKIPELELALEGHIEEHQRFLLELQLQRLWATEKDLATLEQRIQQKLEPYATQLELLDEIPGVDWAVAAVIIAELGAEAATAATRSKGTYLRDKFYSLKARRAYKRVVVALAHKILVATYRLERLGFQVTLELKAA
jgi:transposase